MDKRTNNDFLNTFSLIFVKVRLPKNCAKRKKGNTNTAIFKWLKFKIPLTAKAGTRVKETIPEIPIMVALNTFMFFAEFSMQIACNGPPEEKTPEKNPAITPKLIMPPLFKMTFFLLNNTYPT